MITWTVNEQTADYILKCLHQRPYAEVAQLIPELVNQANVKPEPSPATPPQGE